MCLSAHGCKQAQSPPIDLVLSPGRLQSSLIWLPARAYHFLTEAKGVSQAEHQWSSVGRTRHARTLAQLLMLAAEVSRATDLTSHVTSYIQEASSESG